MIEDCLIESANSGEAQQLSGMTEMQIEVFFLRKGSYGMPVLHEDHAFGSARCGWVESSGKVFLVCVFRIGENAIVRSAQGMELMDFLLTKDRAEQKLIDGEREWFADLLGLLKSQIELHS